MEELGSKLGYFDNGDLKPWVWPDVFARLPMKQGYRLAIGPSRPLHILRKLAEVMNPPFKLLFVLLPDGRSVAEKGRYESGALDPGDLVEFFDKFGDLIENDARHELWLHSGGDGSLLVLDSHNRIYAYVALEAFEIILAAEGFSECDPQVDFQHYHRFSEKLDQLETELLEWTDWTHLPLQDQDFGK